MQPGHSRRQDASTAETQRMRAAISRLGVRARTLWFVVLSGCAGTPLLKAMPAESDVERCVNERIALKAVRESVSRVVQVRVASIEASGGEVVVFVEGIGRDARPGFHWWVTIDQTTCTYTLSVGK